MNTTASDSVDSEFDQYIHDAIESVEPLKRQHEGTKLAMVLGSKLFLRILVELNQLEPRLSLADALLVYATMAKSPAKR